MRCAAVTFNMAKLTIIHCLVNKIMIDFYMAHVPFIA